VYFIGHVGSISGADPPMMLDDFKIFVVCWSAVAILQVLLETRFGGIKQSPRSC